MSKPVSTQKEPYEVELEAGKYWWCACGQSKKQPFCDGSHMDADVTPVEFSIEEKKTVWLCGCRKSGNKPMCDGTHKK